MTLSSKLRILHLVAIRGKGGTGASTQVLVEGLADKGHDVAVVCFKRGFLYKSLVGKGKVKLVTGIKMAPGFRPHQWFKDLRRLYPFVREFKPHIIHTHSSPDYWLGFILSLMTRSPLVRSRHIPVSLTPHSFNLMLYRKTAAVVAVSHAVGDRYFKGVRWNPQKVRVIYDGVDLGRFNCSWDGQEVRGEVGVAPDDILMGSVSRYSEVKGLPHFLEALEKVTARDGRVKGVVLGRVKSKGLYGGLKDWVKAKGLEGRIYLLGHRGDVEKVLAALDVAVLASIGSEGSSRVALEAGAMGKPLLATLVGALPEVVVDGKTGFIVPPRDVMAMSQALTKLLNPKTRKGMGRNTKVRIRRLFDGYRGIEVTEELYLSIKGSK